MRRREFITLLGGATVAWPLAARAQRAAKVYRIGFLSAGAEVRPPTNWSIFVNGLRDLGWIEGKNIVFDRRYADNRLDWPAPGSEDTELGVLMELEVGHGETEVYARVQA